jgi:hypothetical protein
MFKSALVIAAFLATVPAQADPAAAAFRCRGGVLNYGFTLTGTIVGNRAVGQARIVVTQNGNVLRQGSAPVRSSSFLEGRSFSVVSQDAHARIEVQTAYQSPGVYTGTMAINSDQGNTSVSTICAIQ